LLCAKESVRVQVSRDRDYLKNAVHKEERECDECDLLYAHPRFVDRSPKRDGANDCANLNHVGVRIVLAPPVARAPKSAIVGRSRQRRAGGTGRRGSRTNTPSASPGG
jgi:hypothetical protein